jgi:hypothetical protein
MKQHEGRTTKQTTLLEGETFFVVFPCRSSIQTFSARGQPYGGQTATIVRRTCGRAKNFAGALHALVFPDLHRVASWKLSSRFVFFAGLKRFTK